MGVAVISALGAGSARAQGELSFEAGGVTLQAPQGWYADAKPDLLVFMDKIGDDAAAMVTVGVLQASSLQAAVADLDKAVAAVVKDARGSGTPQEVTFNDLPALWITSAGTLNGRAVELRSALVAAPNGKVLMLLAIFDAARADAFEGVVKGLAQSVRAKGP